MKEFLIAQRVVQQRYGIGIRRLLPQGKGPVGVQVHVDPSGESEILHRSREAAEIVNTGAAPLQFQLRPGGAGLHGRDKEVEMMPSPVSSQVGDELVDRYLSPRNYR